MQKEKLLCKLAKVRNMGVEFEFYLRQAFVIDYCLKSKRIVLHMVSYIEFYTSAYAVTLGDGGKDTLVRGVWIKNRGLFTLGSPL